MGRIAGAVRSLWRAVRVRRTQGSDGDVSGPPCEARRRPRTKAEQLVEDGRVGRDEWDAHLPEARRRRYFPTEKRMRTTRGIRMAFESLIWAK